jgi:hypothetical protein
MALPANLIPSKDVLIKERERERLHRYLFIKFGRKKFDMHWTDAETSFTDYASIYVKYHLQTPQHRIFTPDELRMLRKGHAVHERGHIEYDVAGVTYNWRMEHVSNDRTLWAANEKYPMGWLKYFSGIMVDVRMEYFTIMDLPESKEYFDFCNYYWRFGVRGEKAGENRLLDFQECLAGRGFNLVDIPEWHPDAVALVDSVQSMIDDVRNSSSTQEGMDNTTHIVKAVWPTLYEWMQEDKQEDEENHPNPDESGHDISKWGDPDEVQQNSERVVIKIKLVREEKEKEEEPEEKQSGGSEDEEEADSEGGSGSSHADTDNEDAGEGEAVAGSSDSSGANETEESESDVPEFKAALKAIQAEISSDEKVAEEEIGAYIPQTLEVQIDEDRKDRKAFSDEVVILPYHNYNLEKYKQTQAEIKRLIQPTASALKKLLEPTKDQRYTNQRSGKLNVSKVWSASLMDDPNVFNRKVNGTPGLDARILVLNDISGSTGGSFGSTGTKRIDAMRNAMILLSESAESAKIPMAAYGFTENMYQLTPSVKIGRDVDHSNPNAKQGTIIYPFKPFGKFGNVEKGFLGGVISESGNRDTLALQWGVNELMKYREGVRLLIVLSDGEPCFEDNEDEQTMRSIVQQAQKKGIDVLCLFIGEAYSFEMVKFMYPGGALLVTKNLPRDLTAQVTQIIKRRRK